MATQRFSRDVTDELKAKQRSGKITYHDLADGTKQASDQKINFIMEGWATNTEELFNICLVADDGDYALSMHYLHHNPLIVYGPENISDDMKRVGYYRWSLHEVLKIDA
ncbi:unnamed protein product [Arabis nemorensis]|uniref:Uncharacterized protein n=1 Tax=Arabis nemorensis TaxID=586526 RepID=A0A565BXD0_9BRAS|nr:unnamed protein product [Arabis nemorensis]